MTAMYGSEVEPNDPIQDMSKIDTLAGAVADRDSSPATFTGGMGGMGLGGQAEPDAPPKEKLP